MKFRFKFFAVLVFLIAFSSLAFAQSAVIYKNESCGHCTPYLNSLRELLESNGFPIIEKDFVNDLDARVEVVQLHQKNNIPVELQGHMVTVLNGSLILEGHVPMQTIEEVLQKYPSKNFPKIVIYEDSMD